MTKYKLVIVILATMVAISQEVPRSMNMSNRFWNWFRNNPDIYTVLPGAYPITNPEILNKLWVMQSEMESKLHIVRKHPQFYTYPPNTWIDCRYVNCYGLKVSKDIVRNKVLASGYTNVKRGIIAIESSYLYGHIELLPNLAKHEFTHYLTGSTLHCQRFFKEEWDNIYPWQQLVKC